MGRIVFGTLLAVATAWGTPLAAQESTKKRDSVQVETVYRASTIKGMGVYNREGDKVGTVDELVIDVEKGQVVYAALSVGGFLGVGDKLFAIPWREFTLEVGEDGKFFRIDVTKEKLQKAEGFDKDAWPNVADPKWRQRIDAQFRERTTTSEERRSTSEEKRSTRDRE